MSVDVTVAGPQDRLAAFVQALENMDRAFLVKSINIAGTGEGGGSSLTLSGTMFLLPELVDPTAEAPVPDATATDPTTTDPTTTDPTTTEVEGTETVTP